MTEPSGNDAAGGAADSGRPLGASPPIPSVSVSSDDEATPVIERPARDDPDHSQIPRHEAATTDVTEDVSAAISAGVAAAVAVAVTAAVQPLQKEQAKMRAESHFLTSRVEMLEAGSKASSTPTRPEPSANSLETFKGKVMALVNSRIERSEARVNYRMGRLAARTSALEYRLLGMTRGIMSIWESLRNLAANVTRLGQTVWRSQ